MAACKSGAIDILEWMKTRGLAVANLRCTSGNVWCPPFSDGGVDGEGDYLSNATPFLMACYSGHVAVLDWLLNNGLTHEDILVSGTRVYIYIILTYN